MKNKKDIVKILIVISAGIILLNLVGNFSIRLETASKIIDVLEYNKYKVIIAFLMTLFGVLIEWRDVVKILTKGFCFRWSCFTIAILIIMFPMIPLQIMLNIFKNKAAIYTSVYVSTTLSILGGILLVRSFKK